VNEKDAKFLTKETDGFLGHDMKVFGDVLADFAREPRQPDRATSETDVAFEYRIDCEWQKNTQTFTRTMRFGYPKIRNDKSTADHVVFEYPGSINNFTYEESAEDSALRAWASGAGQGNEKIAQMRYSKARASEGFLLTETVESHSDVEQPSILYARATNDLQTKKIPRPNLIVNAIGHEFPLFMTPEGQTGAWRVGDWASFVLRDPLFFAASGDNRGIATARGRIIGYTVTLENDQAAHPTEFIDLELADVEFGV
jgi:hypothetical protein